MKYRILTVNDKNDLKTLRKISKPVEVFDHGLRFFIEELKDICYKEGGAGLSAIQVGNPIRVLIYALDMNLDRFAVMVNPVIKFASYTNVKTTEEGCLSIPKKTIHVTRPSTIMVAYQDGRGNYKIKKLKYPQSTIVQHELDHLDGKLLVDYE